MMQMPFPRADEVLLKGVNELFMLLLAEQWATTALRREHPARLGVSHSLQAITALCRERPARLGVSHSWARVARPLPQPASERLRRWHQCWLHRWHPCRLQLHCPRVWQRLRRGHPRPRWRQRAL